MLSDRAELAAPFALKRNPADVAASRYFARISKETVSGVIV